MEEWKAELTLEPPTGFEPYNLAWESSTVTTRPLLLNKLSYFVQLNKVTPLKKLLQKENDKTRKNPELVLK